MKKVLKIIIKILAVPAILAIVGIGFFMPDIAMAVEDRKNNKVTVVALDEVSLSIVEEPSIEEKLYLLYSDKVITFSTDKTKKDEAEIKQLTESIMKDMYYNFNNRNGNYDINYDLVEADIYMSSEVNKAAIWSVSFSVSNAEYYRFMIDDTTGELLFFDYENKAEADVYPGKGNSIAEYLIGLMPSEIEAYEEHYDDQLSVYYIYTLKTENYAITLGCNDYSVSVWNFEKITEDTRDDAEYDDRSEDNFEDDYRDGEKDRNEGRR